MSFLNQKQLEDKIYRYESFLNDKLKNDLKVVLEQRNSVSQEASEYLQLKNVIERLKSSNSSADDHVEGSSCSHIKTMVDLGASFYCKAKIEKCDKIFVAVGYGFFAEFTFDEALSFIEKKVAHLTSKVDCLATQAAEINARIRIVIEGLRELQFGIVK